MNLKPTTTHVLFLPIKYEKTNVIFIPEAVKAPEPIGRVVAVGPEVTVCKAGDLILLTALKPYESLPSSLGSNNTLCEQKDILGVVEE